MNIKNPERLLELCKSYKNDCDTRIDCIIEELEACGYDLDGLEQNYEEDKYCEGSDYIEQIEHWKATRAMVEKAIAEATA